MQANKTVTINGRMYDAVTGLPIEKKAATKPATISARPARRSVPTASSNVHQAPQRSQTLHRRAAKKSTLGVKRPQPGRHMDISRSSSVKRFASHPVTHSKKPAPTSTPDITPKPHPAAARALASSTKPVAPVTAKQVKNAAIASALAKPIVKPKKESRLTLRWSRRFTIVTACFAVLIIGAYLTWVNIPALSVSVASAQAGVKATYPEYRPDGYRLDQPVTYKEGEVTLMFSSNSGAGGYTIVQKNSSWDSSAVLDNVVKKTAGDNYITTQERGLTIYSYGSNAVWVNGGILYSINATAPLSGEQIRHIATSL